MNRWLACLSLLVSALLPLSNAALAAPAADAGLTCPPAAQPLTAESAAAGMRDAKDHGFLWRLQKDGRTSYLYGTIHAARQEWMFPGPAVMEALRESSVVALELDVLDPAIQRRLVASIGSRRGEALPTELQRRLARRMAHECVDAAAFAAYAPEFQLASLTMLAARRDGFDPAYAIDLVLAGVARSIGKPLISLETPEAQMAALQMPTQAETVALVGAGLDELESGRARPLMSRIARVWVEGDYAQLSRYAEWCGCTGTEAERNATRRLLDDRNPALADGIDALHGTGQQVFAAVGSLHMVGPLGLPELLRKRGYKVAQGDFAR